MNIYYVFDNPIDLYPNIKIQLKSLKYDLTFRMWEYGGTSQIEAIQYQSINQGFRMVGSLNEKHGKALNSGLKSCIECGSCSYVCPAKRPLTQTMRLAKATLRKEQSK